MRIIYNTLFAKKTWLLATIFSFYFLMHSCVPIRKQLIIQDVSKKNLKELRKTDTILSYPTFNYYLQPRDVIGITLSSITKGEYDLGLVSQIGNISGSEIGMSGAGGGGGTNGRNGYIINDSGYVILPILGKIKARGLTLKEIEYNIQHVVNQYFDNTIVNIRMLNYYVYFMGETSLRGRVFSPTDKLTLLEAIALSGGFSEFANRSKIKIIRNQKNTAHVYYVDLLNQDIITQNQIYLMPNDIIYVEPLRSKNIRTYTISNITLAASSLTLLIGLYLTFHSLSK